MFFFQDIGVLVHDLIHCLTCAVRNRFFSGIDHHESLMKSCSAQAISPDALLTCALKRVLQMKAQLPSLLFGMLTLPFLFNEPELFMSGIRQTGAYRGLQSDSVHKAMIIMIVFISPPMI